MSTSSKTFKEVHFETFYCHNFFIVNEKARINSIYEALQKYGKKSERPWLLESRTAVNKGIEDT